MQKSDLKKAIGHGGIKALVELTGYSRNWISLVLRGVYNSEDVIKAAVKYANERKKAKIAFDERVSKQVRRILEK